MISAKKAISAAKLYLSDLSDIPITSIWLEEIEYKDAEHLWLLTLSYPAFFEIYEELFVSRVYKAFKVNSETGAVISMKRNQ